MYQHCLNKFLIKQQLKSVDLSPKSCFWTSKQPIDIDFLLTTGNACPAAIPEIFVRVKHKYLITGNSFIGQLKMSGTKSKYKLSFVLIL